MTKDAKLKRQGSRVDKSESLRKRKRKFVQNRKLIETPCGRNFKTVVEEYVSSTHYKFWCCCRCWMVYHHQLFSRHRLTIWSYWWSSFTRGIWAEWLSNEKNTGAQSSFLQKNDFANVLKLSIHQFYKIFFSFILKCKSCMQIWKNLGCIR